MIKQVGRKLHPIEPAEYTARIARLSPDLAVEATLQIAKFDRGVVEPFDIRSVGQEVGIVTADEERAHVEIVAPRPHPDIDIRRER